MKRNIGSVDRLIRFFIAVAIGFLYYTDTVKGNFSIAAIGVAVYLFLTSLSGFCLIYAILGINTSPHYHQSDES